MNGVHKRIVKLVRDKVARWLPSGEVSFEKVGRERHVELLRAKLLEEVGEYLLRPSLAELADVWEAVRSLALVDLQLLDGMMSVEAEAMEKYQERGGFDGGLVMVATSTAPERHEGEHTSDDLLSPEIITGCFGL